MNAPEPVPTQDLPSTWGIWDTALNRGDIQQRVDALAAELGRPVLLEDADLSAIVYSQHDDNELDPVRLHSILRQRVAPELVAEVTRVGVGSERSPFRIPALPRWKMRARLCIPVRAGDTAVGYLWISDPDRTMSTEQERLGALVADDLALMLDRVKLERHRAEWTTQALLRRLLEGTGDAVRAASELVAHEGLPSQPCAVAVVAELEGRSTAVRAASNEAIDLALAIGSRLRGTRTAARWLVFVTDRIVLLAVPPKSMENGPNEIAETVRCALATYFGCRVAIGTSGTAEPLDRAHTSWRRAAAALNVASSVDGAGGIRSWSDLGSWRLLSRLADMPGRDDELTADLHPGVLELLREDRAALLSTVETYFDLAGDASATAAALHLHRSTLYYRLDKISERTGLDLRTGEARFELMLGLRLARIAGLRRPTC